MSFDDMRNILEETSLFGTCEDGVLAAAVSCSDCMAYEPDDLVYEEGSVSRDAFVVSDGSVRVARPGSKEQDAAFIARRSDLFGLITALTGEARRTTAAIVSDEEACCIRVDVDSFLDRLEDDGLQIRSFYGEVIDLMSSRLLRSSRIIDTLL